MFSPANPSTTLPSTNPIIAPIGPPNDHPNVAPKYFVKLAIFIFEIQRYIRRRKIKPISLSLYPIIKYAIYVSRRTRKTYASRT
jgi:hypothetical protein